MGGFRRRSAANSLRARAVAVLALGFASLLVLGAFEAMDEGRVISAERAAVAVRQVAADDQALGAALAAQQTALNTYVDSLSTADHTPHGLGTHADLLNDYLTASGEAQAALKRLTGDARRSGVDPTSPMRSAEAWQNWATERRAQAETDPPSPPTPAFQADGISLFATFSADDRIFADRVAVAEASATALASDLNASHARVFFSGLAVEAAALLLLGLALIRQVLTPVSRLTDAAADLAAGRAARVPYQDRSDEVGSLARALVSWQRASAEMFKVFQRSPIGIARLGADGQVLEANPSLEQMLGVPHDSLTGQNLVDLVAVEDRDMVTARVKELAVDDPKPTGRPRQDSVALEARHLRSDGTFFWTDITLAAVPAEDGSRYLLAMLEDVDVRKRQELELRHQAGHDALTQLPNRSLFEDRLGQAILTARRRGGPLAVLVLDLDRFKPVNDDLGHHAGDEVLRQAARRLRKALRQSDTIARLGGDEFAVVLAGEDREGAERTAAKLERVMDPSFEVGGESRSVGLSAGIAIYPDDGTEAQQLLAEADAAMYRAKRDHHIAARASGY
jgi:diguanylate cyclase (GGDEF)-like protein/PAS domain S-box-containing protein